MTFKRNHTHTLKTIKSAPICGAFDAKGLLLLCEISREGTSEQDPHRFYVVRNYGNQVLSAIPADYPSDGGTWVARLSPSGVDYVANGRTRAVAQRWFARLVAQSKEDLHFLSDSF